MSRLQILHAMGSLVANDVGEGMVPIHGRLSRSTFEPRTVTLGRCEEFNQQIQGIEVLTSMLGLLGPPGTVQALGKVGDLIRESGVDVLHGCGSWGGALAELAAPREVGLTCGGYGSLGC
ncbi:MAG: hypothetical protein P8L45_11355 [Longimicrobiales bacterium]|nr:hypothetical protein [Longimicrobiales bacterium]